MKWILCQIADSDDIPDAVEWLESNVDKDKFRNRTIYIDHRTIRSRSFVFQEEQDIVAFRLKFKCTMLS